MFLTLSAAMGFVYAALHKAGLWYKIGFAANVGARHARGYWSNSHPAELCNSLAPSDWQLVGAWKIESEEREQELHRQLNEGGIHKGDKHDEMYPALEFPKIKRDLDTFLEIAPLPAELPPNDANQRLESCCRQAKDPTAFRHYCADCGTTFGNGGAWRKHRLNPPKRCAKRARI